MGWEPVAIVVVLVGGVVKMVQARQGRRDDRRDATIAFPPRDDADAVRLRDDLARLKVRVAVLERIVTDGDRERGLVLDREIEALRADRPDAATGRGRS